MLFGIGYLSVSVLTFMALTSYWLRVKRPVDEDGNEWTDESITGFGVLQSLVWFVFIPLYTIRAIFLGVVTLAKSWVNLVAPPVRAISGPVKDPYIARAEMEVEAVLADHFEILDDTPYP